MFSATGLLFEFVVGVLQKVLKFAIAGCGSFVTHMPSY